MPDILQDFPVNAPAARVFEAISSPSGLDRWWTERCTGDRRTGGVYRLSFGPDYDWRGTVTVWRPDVEFELAISDADADWNGTRVGFILEPRGGSTMVRFRHTNWPSTNEHYRVSTHCWALYLRILRRYLEHDESVPYDRRLDV